MQTLKILEQIAVIREYTIRLLDGKTSAKEVQAEIELLNDMLLLRAEQAETLSGVSSVRRNPKGFPVENSNTESVDETPTLSDSKLFINSNNILLFEVERNKKGIAFQEKHGFIIFVEHQHLKDFKPVNKHILDFNGLEWEVSLTDNENVVTATNEIGDVVTGMRAVEQLITGEDPMEMRK